MRINETEIINNAIASKETISNYTIISRHPWVEDTEEELKRIDEEENTFDKVPLCCLRQCPRCCRYMCRF